MIEGMIDVYLMDDDGIIFEKIKLNDNRNFDSGNFYYELSSSYYHFVVQDQNGQFTMKYLQGHLLNLRILYGKFAPSENASFESIKNYVNNIFETSHHINLISDE